MTYTVDEEGAREGFLTSALHDLDEGLVTAYAVACVGNDDEHFSHGGFLLLDAEEALEAAVQSNAHEDNAGCRYLPIPVGIEFGALGVLWGLATGTIVVEEGTDGR